MKQTILFAVFLVSGLLGIAQNPLVKQWDKRFGGSNYDYLNALLQTYDGGFLLGGITYSISSGDVSQPSQGGADFWVVKTDSVGSKVWDKRFGGNGGDVLYSLELTVDGGYILGGTTWSDSSGDVSQPKKGGEDYWLVKLDLFGNKEWDKRFGGNDRDILHSVKQTLDGGYILGGNTESNNDSGDVTQPSKGYVDYWIVKTDSYGNKQWDKRFGGTLWDGFSSLCQTSDGGYILLGSSSSDTCIDKTQACWDTSTSPLTAHADYWIVKIDSMGNEQWDKRYGGIDFDSPASINQTSDAGFILAGISFSENDGDKTQACWDTSTSPFGSHGDFWIVKIDSLGNRQWDKDFGGFSGEELRYIVKTKDGGYFLSGESYSQATGDKSENNLGQGQGWIVKVDSAGNKQWEKTIFTTGHDEGGCAIQSKDGCYVIAISSNGGIGGYKTQAGRGELDFWIVKFCDTTTITNVFPLSLQEEPQVRIYPNPATSQLFIESSEEIKQVNIYNTMGEVVMAVQSSTFNHQLSIINLPYGVYIAEIKTKDASVKKRWVKE